jgi:WD40 repeat protein
MKLRPKSFQIAIAIGLVLAACGPQATEEIAAPLPTETTSPTETPDLAAIPPESRLTTKCIETTDASLDSLQLSGSLFVVAIDENNKTYLWNLSSGQKRQVDTGTTHIVLSPDRARLAAINRRIEALVIFDAGGTNLLEIPDWGDEYDIIQWLKDSQLVIKTPLGDSSYEPDAILIFDIGTKERQEIVPDIPLITTFFQDISWGGYSLSPMVPNPQLTHLVYSASEEDDNLLIIWDLQNELEVGRIYNHGSANTGVYTSAPAWSRDGTSFITSAMLRYTFDPKNDDEPIHPLGSAAEATDNSFINVDDAAAYLSGFELIRVNQSGQAQRLSYLTTTFNASQEDWVWSPDETRIAFWLTIEDDQFPLRDTLAVLDVASGEVTQYCISGYRTPIWSPDGRQIAINQNIDSRDTFKIVDLEAGVAYAIAGEGAMKVEGWMVPPP